MTCATSSDVLLDRLLNRNVVLDTLESHDVTNTRMKHLLST